MVRFRVKFNAQKPRLSLVSNALVYGAARALDFGSRKHSRDNYKLVGRPLTEIYDACLRHLTEWKEGREYDPESGLAVLEHSAAQLSILLDTIDRIDAGRLPRELDDRFEEFKKDGLQ